MPLTLNGSDQTALLVVDMQNGFCHPQGSFATLGLDVSMCNAAIAGCRRLVDAAHAAAVPVIYTRYVYRADYRDGGVLVQEIMPALGSSGSLAAGSWDAELVELARPAPTTSSSTRTGTRPSTAPAWSRC